MQLKTKEDAEALKSVIGKVEWHYHEILRAIADGAIVWIFQTAEEVDADPTVPPEDKARFKAIVQGDLDGGAIFSFLYRNLPRPPSADAILMGVPTPGYDSHGNYRGGGGGGGHDSIH